MIMFTGNYNYGFEPIFRHVHACYKAIEEMKNYNVGLLQIILQIKFAVGKQLLSWWETI